MQNPLVAFQGNLALNSVAPFLSAWKNKKVHGLHMREQFLRDGRARSITTVGWGFVLNEDGVAVPNAPLPDVTIMGCHWRRPRRARRPA